LIYSGGGKIMNAKQAFVTLLLIIILFYVGLYGVIHNLINKSDIDHYVLFIMNIIPSASILLGLLVRVLLGRSETLSKFMISAVVCTISCVLLTVLYTLSYETMFMLSDVFGFIMYCLIVNIFMLICNSIITIMGLN
jgi:hypothetical protein